MSLSLKCERSIRIHGLVAFVLVDFIADLFQPVKLSWILCVPTFDILSVARSDVPHQQRFVGLMRGDWRLSKQYRCFGIQVSSIKVVR